MTCHSPRFTLLLTLGVVLLFSGCAGKSELAQTSENLERNLASESLDSPGETEEEFDEEFFDPFEDPDEEVLEEYDPLEPVNAAIFEFNYQFDRFVVKPIAKVWNFFIPPDVQQSSPTSSKICSRSPVCSTTCFKENLREQELRPVAF